MCLCNFKRLGAGGVETVSLAVVVVAISFSVVCSLFVAHYQVIFAFQFDQFQLKRFLAEK